MSEESPTDLALPWKVEDDGDDFVIVSRGQSIEIARIHHAQGADAVARFIVAACNAAGAAVVLETAPQDDPPESPARLPAPTVACGECLRPPPRHAPDCSQRGMRATW